LGVGGCGFGPPPPPPTPQTPIPNPQIFYILIIFYKSNKKNKYK